MYDINDAGKGIPGMKKLKIGSWVAVVVWMAVIFIFSAQPADQSSELSKGVTEILVSVAAVVFPIDMESGATQNFIDKLDGMIRVGAHGTVFLILALLMLNALRRSGLKGIKMFLITFAFCAFYAITDEIHQIFVPGRACELFDFIVDCIGAALGTVFISFIISKQSRRMH